VTNLLKLFLSMVRDMIESLRTT